MSHQYLDEINTLASDAQDYRAVVETGGIQHVARYMQEQDLCAHKVFIITDTNVDKHYSADVAQQCAAVGAESQVLVIPAGEENKSLEQAGHLVQQLSDLQANRNDTIVALGGGVVGDLGGFVASIYNRGISLVHVPTTLLAMVDSSIGGKTGVDHGGKNKTGTFYQPQLIVADPGVLGTLDSRVYTEGLGEVAKYAVLDKDFFTELQAKANEVCAFDQKALPTIGSVIARCVRQKSDIVQADQFEGESNQRVLLNYGHTLAHGLEAATGYTELLHGEAVAIGMMYAAQLSRHLGHTDTQFVEEQSSLLASLGLPTQYTGRASRQDIVQHMSRDKKNTHESDIRFVLPITPGEMIIQQVSKEIVDSTLQNFL
ncbi:3-dehydroquinate synthase [Candidatus Saccharibacteria bacterium]|nr:3-dehydroquinate synthase [Candidatus Saccharibacteria bacterium]